MAFPSQFPGSLARRRLVLAAFVSTLAAVPAGFAVGCSKGVDEGSATSQSEVEEAADAASDVWVPRRVCPSTRLPDGGWQKVDGIDTSDYQFTDYEQVARENPLIKYAFIRVGAGLVRTDTRFSFDWAKVKRVGLIRGAYMYFKPSQSAVAQADFFLQRLRDVGGLEADDFPPVFDIETTNNMPIETVICRNKIWLARVERATKRIPIIYTSANQNSFLGTELARYPLWVANYVGTPSMTCPRMPDAWPKWDFWQHTDSARVFGVYSNANRDDDAGGGGIAMQDGGGPVIAKCDANYYDGTLEQMRALIASTHSTGEIEDPPPLANPPPVSGASTTVGGPVDCADGCCTAVP